MQVKLAEPFIPCPMCGGTLDMITWSKSKCENCEQEWNHITHEPIIIDPEEEIRKFQAILASG